MRYCTYALLTAVLVLAGCQKDSTDSDSSTDMMATPADMGPDAMSSSDGGMEADTSTIAPDMGMMGGSCGEGSIKDFVAEATMAEDGTLTLEDQPRGRADFAGSCGGDGNEQGYRFTAPRREPDTVNSGFRTDTGCAAATARTPINHLVTVFRDGSC